MKTRISIGIAAVVLVLLGAWKLTSVFSSSSDPSPEAKTQTVAEVYTCPMHPAVRSDTFGECPMCGMDLVKKSVPDGAATRSTEQPQEYYTCPMHESVHADHTGSCPVCGMTLVKKSMQEEMAVSDLSSLHAVSLSPTQRVMANITTAKVHRRTITYDIQAVGIVSYAEPNYRILSIRFAGRIEKLYLTFTGQTVQKGDPVADVYSPDASVEIQTYLRTLDMFNQTTRSGGEITDPVSAALKRQKLRLLQLGFTEKQIAELSESDTLSTYVTIRSPVSGTVVKKNIDPGRFAEAGASLFDVADLSTVWILLDVYEADLRFIRLQQSVQITTSAYPSEKFKGRVVFIDPVLNPESRTVRVRTEFRNPHGKLKPNMYVNATIAAAKTGGLVVPSSAILSMGKGSVAWVEVRENVFEPRYVVVGETNDGFTVVLSGLNEGESVAVTGGFLIDAESALTQPVADEAHQGQNDSPH